MLRVKKGNKVYQISEADEKSYLAQGYDTIDEKGNITKHAANSTVPYSVYAKVVKELDELKAAVEKDTDKKGTKQSKEKADKSEEE